MPAKLERCVEEVKRKGGKGAKNPFAICVASTGLKPHGGKRK